MANALVNRFRGMNPWLKGGVVLLFTLAVSIISYQGWYSPSSITAAIGVPGQWGTALSNGTASPLTATYAVPAGSNRVMVVAVTGQFNKNPTGGTVTVTYGGTVTRTLTAITETRAQNSVWIGYLNEADIAAVNGTTITATVAYTGGGLSMTRIAAHAATYSGVDQTTPVLDFSAANSTGASALSFGKTLTTANGGYVFYATNLGVASAGQVTPPADNSYSEHVDEVLGSTYNVSIASKTTGAATEANQSVTFATGGRCTLGVVSLNPYVPAGTMVVGGLGNALTASTVQQGDQNVPVLSFALTANAAGTWTGGLLDKIGTNANLGDVAFNIYKDNGDGTFSSTSDTKIGGPYSFSSASGSSYTLPAAETLGSTPQRYFVTYNIGNFAAAGTTVGARIVDASYFTATGGLTVSSITSTSSSMPTINATGTAVQKTYMADWDSGTTLNAPVETGGPSATSSTCLSTTTNYTGASPLVGLLNYPAHTCQSSAAAYYQWNTNSANANFIRLYFNGANGYSNQMITVQPASFKARFSATSYPATFTITSFIVAPGGAITYATSTNYNASAAITATVPLTGQTFSSVVPGSRLGIQIGVNKKGCQIALGGAVGSQLVVNETAVVNNNIDIGDGQVILNRNVFAPQTDVVMNAFSLTNPDATGKTVSEITVTGTAGFTSANVAAVKIYTDGGTPGVIDGSDANIATGAASWAGSVATVPVSFTLNSGASANYLVVVDVKDTATVAATLKGFVTGLGSLPVDTAGDTTAATLTVQATTTVGNGTAEPGDLRITAGSAAQKLDAFSLKVNGGASDPITTVSVTLAPAGISGDSQNASKIDKVEIINGAGFVYGYSVLATQGDRWDIAVTGLSATTTSTDYYVRITPKPAGAILSGVYPVTGKVTSVAHDLSANGLIIGDSGSSTLSIDTEPPIGPSSLTASTSISTDGAINLTWAPASDPNGGSLDGTTPFRIVRGNKNQPAPTSCSTGIDISTEPGNSVDQVARTATVVNLESQVSSLYGFRVCAIDNVGNVSSGTTASAAPKLTMTCNQTPTLIVLPASQVVKSVGKPSTPYQITVSNHDVGACGTTTFALSLDNLSANSNNFTWSISPPTMDLTPGNALQAQLVINGTPSAEQLEELTFKVKASATGYPAGLSSLLTATLNDMPPIVHNSSNMGSNRYGNWGSKFTCATCHLQSSPNIKNVFNRVSSPTGIRQVYFTNISTSASVTAGVFGNDRRPDATRSTNICEVCHHRTVQHQYSSNKSLGGPVGLESPYNKDHHNSADCMQCHPHNQAFKSIKGVCGDCHGRRETKFAPYDGASMAVPPTNALGSTPPDYGAHSRHSMETVGCAACHSNGNHVGASVWVGDAKIDIGFRISSSTYGRLNPTVAVSGGSYTGNSDITGFYTWNAAPGTTLVTQSGFATCSVYCHGAWTGNAGFNTNPNWTGANQSDCGACHYATNANPPTSGSHVKHAAGGILGIGLACSKCHGAFANLTSGAHINGNVEWNLSQVAADARYEGQTVGSTGALAPSANFGVCSNLYCHSNVQGANGTGGPTSYASPKWGDAATATCGSCHNYLPTTGGHTQHTNDPLTMFDCHICHNQGGTTNLAKHADGTIDMTFVGLGANTVYSAGSQVAPGTAYGKCSTSDCHGRFNRTWGPSTALPLCDKCHGSRTSARGFYSTEGPDGTLSNYTSFVGTHDIHLQQTNAPRRASFARFTSYNSGFNCNQCHFTPTSPYSNGHVDTALPAEIRFTHLSSIAQNAVKFGVYTTVARYSYADRTCSSVWCHGRGMNSNELTGPYATVFEDATSAHVQLNLVQPVVPAWNSPMLTGNSANDCTKCHNYPPPAPTVVYQHYGKTLTDCVSCHKHMTSDGGGFKNKTLHVNGVVDGGCAGCHGNPPIDATIGTSTGLATPATGALTADVAGAHQAHLLVPTISNNCATCHNNYVQEMGSGTIDIGFNALGGRVTSGTFTGYSATTNGERFVSTSAGTTVLKNTNRSQSNVCSNLYCHGGGTDTLAALGGGTNAAPNWEQSGASQIGCGTCHGVSATTAPTFGSHNRHARNDQDGRLGLACSQCHGTVTDNYHVDGKVAWSLNRGNALFGSSATYNGYSAGFRDNLAPSAVYQNCANVYCHSNVQGATGTGSPSSYKSIQWGSAALTCAGCHADMAIDTVNDTGTHEKHANTTGSGLGRGCNTCHNGGGKDKATHADGSIFVSFTSSIGGSYSGNGRPAGSAAGYGTCTTTFCHGSGGLKPAPTWGGAPLACDACHSAKVDDTTWSGRHATHYNYSTMPGSYSSSPLVQSSATKYRYTCAACHDPDVTKHGLGPASANSAANVFFGFSGNRRGTYSAGSVQVPTDNGFKWTNGTCNTSYCHSNGKGGNPLVMTATWASSAGSLNCTGCHDGKTTGTATTLSGKHDAHMNTTTNSSLGLANGFNCVDCHAKTITNSNNTTLADKAKHVNVLLDYSGARAGGSSRYNAATKVCSNIYCHSNGNPGAVVFVSMTGSKTWTGGATLGCNGCHGRTTTNGAPDYAPGTVGSPTANGHQSHVVAGSATTVCSDCHVRTASKTVASKFVDYTAATTHLNGTPNVYFRSTMGAGAGYNTGNGQCSNVICHGAGQPQWGLTSASPKCEKCHGFRSTTWNALNGATATSDGKVGAHFNHISSTTYKYNRTFSCQECHSDSIALATDSTASATHFNNAGTGKVNWATGSPLAKTGGANPTYNGTSCANVYCHGATLPASNPARTAPVWNTSVLSGSASVKGDGVSGGTSPGSGNCAMCHGYPPQNNHSTLACNSCHTHLNTDDLTFKDPTLHINGTVNFVANCDSCHDYDTRNGGTTWGKTTYGVEGSGAHAKHIEYIKSRWSVTLSPTTDSFGTGAAAAVCGVCHTNTGADHSTSLTVNTRSINFGGSTARQFGASAPSYSGLTGTSSSVNPKSCANTDCHYKASPLWSTY
jgi:predicted CxxxxCH...CXXCH cytochrome family protein